jgi:uncharacterized protein YbaR (Trm112 family)
MDKALMKILVCPETRRALVEVDAGVLVRLNQAVAAGKVRNQGGRPVEKPLEAGLMSVDGPVVYPVVDGIPVLLIEEAIRLEQIR